MELTTELLAAHHAEPFDCGKPALNAWLTTHGLANQAKGFTRVIVVCERLRIIGYYGLAPTGVMPRTMPRRIRTGQPPTPVPCILLGQLAVDKDYAGRGIGSALVRDALTRCAASAESIGGRAVITHAIDDDAARFWKACGFIAATDDAKTLFLSIEDVRAWLKDADGSET